jgi:mono/diheme cytochrome c family protein
MRHWLIALTLCLAAPMAGVAGASSTTGIDETAGRKLYAAKCASCHKLYDPVRYDDEKWNSWMNKMRKKARLGDEQYATLSRYLQTLRPSRKEVADAGEKKQ